MLAKKGGALPRGPRSPHPPARGDLRGQEAAGSLVTNSIAGRLGPPVLRLRAASSQSAPPADMSKEPRLTYAFRLVHRDALPTLLERGALHAPSSTPADGLPYPSIHDEDIRARRADLEVPCGPGGKIDDYVSFYFGWHSPMLLRLATGKVGGYRAGQDPLLYLVISVEDLRAARCRFVFTDGHSAARYTRFFDDPEHLAALDWETIRARFWADTAEDNDRERRKQAELLVHGTLPWSAVRGIATRTEEIAGRIRRQIREAGFTTPVKLVPKWYFETKP